MRMYGVMALLLAVMAGTARAQVLRVAEMNTRQIAAVDRSRAVVLMPFGILEQHGPYLPSFTDGYGAERLTSSLADTLAAGGWTVLVFPTIPLGHGGANVIGGKFVYPGSYTVRAATLRAIAMDLLTELAEQDFRRVIVISLHGSAEHNRALGHAGQYFRDEFGGRMLNLFDAVFLNDITAQVFPEAARNADGFSVHSGLRETSELMFLRPELVAADVIRAPSLRGVNMAGLVRIAREPDWPGYFGAPALATTHHGEQAWTAFTALSLETANRFLAGVDPPTPMYSDAMAGDSVHRSIGEGVRSHDRIVEERQRRWLQRRGISP